MELSNGRICYSSRLSGLSLASTVTLFGFLIFLGGPISSSSQDSSPLSSPHNQTSERLGPPLITSGASAQRAQNYSLYQSAQHNFSIEYPSDWSLREGGRAGVVAAFSSSFEDDLDPFAANFAIGVENLTSGTSLDNYTRSVVALLQSRPPAANFSFTGHLISTMFGGLPAQRVGFILTVPSESSFSPETTITGEQIWTIDNDTAYVLSFAAEQNKSTSYSPVMEHILDSFRITRTSE